MLSEESTGRQILIAIEGPDYVGKSTLIRLLDKKLSEQYQHLHHMPVSTVRRPGSTKQCDTLREKIVNTPTNMMSDLTRQAFSLAEEVLFANTFRSDSPIVLFDRYNPISGQIYGPLELRDTWELALKSGITTKMDAVIFVQASKETINERLNGRSDEDCNIIDGIFKKNMVSIIDKYEAMAISPWCKQWCNPHVVHNNGDINTTLEDALSIIQRVI